MINPDVKPSPDDSIEAIAARWIARRDRGLTAAEEAVYRKWLGENPRHAAAMARPEKNWSALDRLAEQFPAQGGPPNPDLLAPHRRSRWIVWAPLLAAAAAVALVYFAGAPPVKQPQRNHAVVHPGPERLALEDGSTVELNTQAQVEVQFTPTERRVRLVRGEAYFKVTRNPARPFIVSTPQVSVQAVGTEFSVALATQEISVLVTEGRVQVAETPGAAGEKSGLPRELPALVAGEEGILSRSDAPQSPNRWEMTVLQLSPAQVDRALSWQGPRLEFFDTPLGDVAADFNRYNRKKLVIHDDETAAILVGGSFRADNVEGFARLLAVGFGVSAFPHGDEIILRKTGAH